MRAHSIVSSKGQIVIPASLRKRYGLKEGTTIRNAVTRATFAISRHFESRP
jgi:bifunctional DNA-binding transcriptional regulator/antitoxin component of YhaV-PrlF toxin-antitoxin module